MSSIANGGNGKRIVVVVTEWSVFVESSRKPSIPQVRIWRSPITLTAWARNPSESSSVWFRVSEPTEESGAPGKIGPMLIVMSLARSRSLCCR
jgi:hypothetical protein